MLNFMLPFCLPGSSHLSIEKISSPDSGLLQHAAFDPKPTLKVSLWTSALLQTADLRIDGN
jgi:hypothetical protein